MATTQPFEIDPVTPTLGAEIRGIRLAEASDEEIAAIRAATLEYRVLFFPDQHLDPASQTAFARRFGPFDVAPFGPKHPEHPEMTLLDQEAPKGQGADSWHTDNTFAECPPSYTILQSFLLPDLGGDTCFSDMYAAYEGLSPAMKGLLEGLTASHDLSRTLRQAIADGNSDADLHEMQLAWPVVHHPVIRTHPETGRRALFVNGNFTTRIDGLSEAESDALLPMLLEQVRSPEYQCRFTWTSGALAMWDNRCVQHYAVPDYTSRRIMHRLTIEGERPV